MTEIVHLSVYSGMADWEFGHAISHINNPEWQRKPGRYTVVTVGATPDPVTTVGGLRLLPDITLADVKPQDSAMLILAGADSWMGPEGPGSGNEEFAATARDFVAHGAPVAAICGATAGLARAGLLDEREHTSAAPEYLAATGYSGSEHYRPDTVAVADRGVITASPVAPIEFAREIFRELDLYRPDVLDAWYRLYAQHDAMAYAELASV